MKIIFTGDFIRPSAAAWRPTQHYNIRWLHDLFAPVLRQLTHADIGYVAWNHAGVLKGGIDGNDIADIYNTCDVTSSMDGWALLYDRAFLPAKVRRRLADLFCDALVIGFEIPPYLKHFLLENGNTYIDFIIHPVRFHDDIFFGVQSSDMRLNAVLADFAMDEEELYLAAGVAGATAGRLSNLPAEPGSSLILMQTRHDKTQIREGRFIGFSDFLAPAFEQGIFNGPVLLKPHPLEPGNPHLRIITSSVKGCRVTSANFYELLCCENIELIVSLSSSTSFEAKYFDKKSIHLYKPPFEMFFKGQNFTYGFESYFSIKDAYYGNNFWNALVEALNFSGLRSSKSKDHTALAIKPNRTRLALKSFWGYNQIDTDIAFREYQEKS